MSLLLAFPDRHAFRQWLGLHGTKSGGIWILFSKKGTSPTLSAADALEEALCHGWIDGRVQSIDDDTYKKYFARRRPASKWSPRNKELAQTLVANGLMTQQGLEAIERAREDGAWGDARRVVICDEQIESLKAIIQPHEPAYTNLLAMPPSVQRTYTGFYFDARTAQGRQARLDKIIDRLNRNLKPM